MGGGSQALKRIPRIKFPQRHPKSSSQSSGPQGEEATKKEVHTMTGRSSEVPQAPQNMGEGGKASLQPKRTPVTDREIEAVMLGGCFD